MKQKTEHRPLFILISPNSNQIEKQVVIFFFYETEKQSWHNN